MPTSIEDGIFGETGFRLNSDPFPSLHTLQPNTPTMAPSKCYTSVCQTSSMPLSSGSTLPSQPNCGSQPQITSTHLACQPISWKQDHSRKNSINVPSISSRHYNLDRAKPRSTSHVQPGPYQHGMSTQSSAVFPEIDNSDGQVVPDTKLNIAPLQLSCPLIIGHLWPLAFTTIIDLERSCSVAFFLSPSAGQTVNFFLFVVFFSVTVSLLLRGWLLGVGHWPFIFSPYRRMTCGLSGLTFCRTGAYLLFFYRRRAVFFLVGIIRLWQFSPPQLDDSSLFLGDQRWIFPWLLATFFPPALHSGSAAQTLATPPSRFKLLLPLGGVVWLRFEEQ